MLKLTIHTLRLSSALFFIYFIAVAYYSGIKSSFLWFYLTYSVAALAISFILPVAYYSQMKLPAFLSRSFFICIWVIIALFLLVQVKILSAASKSPPEGADYLIVLGAQVRGSTPSLALQNRIDAAYEYLEANPDTIVICSGGQGTGEYVTEASAISSSLAEKGISEERILLEERSTNTNENLKFSSEYINIEADTVVIVSSDFHLYRACRIAERAGFKNVSGYSKRDFLLTTPGYYVREFFAVCKDFLFGNM